MRLFLLGLLFVIQGFGLSHAQTSRLWSIAGNFDYILQFEDSTLIKMYASETWKYQYGRPVSVFSNSAGKPLFRDHFYKIIDLPNFKTIKDSDSIYPWVGQVNIFI